MIIGVPREIKVCEYRVGLTPSAAMALVEQGHKVLVEKGAGQGSGISDEEFSRSGAQIIDQKALSNTIPHVEGLYSGSYIRILDDWFQAINKGVKASFHAKVAANFCLSGIQASRSARDDGKPKKIKDYRN